MSARVRRLPSPFELLLIFGAGWVITLVSPLAATREVMASREAPMVQQAGRLVLIQAPGVVVPGAFEFVDSVGLVLRTVSLPASLRTAVDVPEDEVIRIRAVYSGGLRGQTTPISRPPSGEITVPLEKVGAVNIEVEAPYCDGTSTEKIRLALVDRKSDKELIVWSDGLNVCSHVVGGIPPGQYAIDSAPLRGDTLAIERRIVTISDQQRTNVAVRPPEAYLTGVVLINHVELDGGLLQVRSVKGRAYVSTDRLGRFSSEVAGRADFQIALLTGGQERVIAEGYAELGRNNVRVDAIVPTIRLSFQKELDRRLGVTTVYVEGTARTLTYRPADGDSTFVISDLPLGDYKVWAVGPAGHSTSYHSASLSEQVPVAEIGVVFAKQPRAASILNSDGTPAKEVDVDLGLKSQSMTKIAAGVFDLSDWPVGVPLVVKSRGDSTCYRVTNEVKQRIALRKTKPIELQFHGRSGERPATRAIGTFVSSHDCVTDLSRLPFTVLRDDDEAFTLIAQVPDDVVAFRDKDGAVFHITKNITAIIIR